MRYHTSGPVPYLRRLSLLPLAIATLMATLPAASFAQGFKSGLKQDLALGVQPIDVTVADVNGDGRADLLTSLYGASGGTTVGVFLGTGGGLFGPRSNFTTGTGAYRNTVADVNGDGRVDLLVACANANVVSVLLGNGAGGFGPKTDFATCALPEGLAVCDLNGDGRLDLVVSGASSTLVSVLLGQGDGTFAAHVDYTVGYSPSSVVAADVSGDGIPDVIAPAGNLNNVSVLLGKGDGTLLPKTAFATGALPVAVAVGDLNGDGRLDIVTSNVNGNSVSVLLGTGGGAFAAKADYTTTASPYGVAIGDLTGDGKPDLAVGGFTGVVSVLVGTGSGTFGAKTDYAASSGTNDVKIADVDADGRNDIVTANNSGSSLSILLNAYGAGLAPRSDLATTNNAAAVATGDVNGDGKVDLAVGNATVGNVSIHLGNGNGTFGTKTDFTTASGCTGLVFTDVSLDGKLDVVAATGPQNMLSVLLGNGAGGFGAKTDLPTGAYAMFPASADLNNDAKPDLAVPNYSSATVSVFLGSGAGAFGAKTDFATGSSPRWVAIRDVNKDNRPDLVVANSGANTVSVLLGTGTGSFGAKTDFGTGAAPWSVAIADLNADGNQDLVTANNTGNSVSVLLGTGSGTFGTKTDYATALGPASVAVGDVNGDGRLDVVTGDNTTVSPGISVLLGNGAGALGTNIDVSTPSYANHAILADVNGDQRLDVVTGNYTATCSVFLNLEPTSTAVAAGADPVVLGGPMTLRATVTVPSPGTAAPSDSVRFFDGTTRLGTAPVVGSTAGLALFAPYLGTRSITAAYKGDTRTQPSISTPIVLHVVATAKPAIRSIGDVMGDQGGAVRLRFRASPYDVPGSGTPITQYEVYRRLNPSFAPSVTRTAATARGARPMSAMMDGWDYLGAIAAHGDSAYVAVEPTLADSNGAGIHRAVFLVRAATGSPFTYYDSAPDSGYSVDNLPPAAPAPFTAVYVEGATHLHWGASSDSDLWYYRVYRGTSGDFVPGPANLVATCSDTGYVDAGDAGAWYKLSAVDVNGNESPYATLGPGGTVDVPSAGAVALALEGARPNPSRGGALVVRFALPDAAPARLELFSVSGRRVSAQDVGALGAGPHALNLAGGKALPPGLYLVRLSRAGLTLTTRAVVLN
jgi:hypothetical protein